MNMELSSILSEALSGDETRRKQAEMMIDIIASQDFATFLLNCSKELSDESKNKNIRQIAATLIKNMITITEKFKGQWSLLSPDIKAEIKQRVLSTLASSNNDIRKAAGLAVAGMCKTELPLGEWPQIIDILTQTSQNENKNIKLASIITLGFIAQEITVNDLTDEEMCKILNAFHLLLNNTDDTDVISDTLEALLNFIIFTKRFFESKVLLY